MPKHTVKIFRAMSVCEGVMGILVKSHGLGYGPHAATRLESRVFVYPRVVPTFWCIVFGKD